MKCPKCGEENNDSAKFCKSCGESLGTNIVTKTTNDNHKKIIIGLIIVIIAILAIGGLYGMGVFKGEVPLENKDFGGFKIDVPVGSKYVITDATTTNEKNIVISYMNKGKYEYEAFGMIAANNATNEIPIGKLDKKDGNVEIYKNETSEGAIYTAYKEDGNAQIMVVGYDENTVIKMAKSFKEIDMKKMASTAAEPSSVSQQTSSTSSAPASSTPSSISILGGSFSTGSADADKTYARINVGTAHAGEDVIVQIFYSRDGNSLNNGNMVPATVHSDGYLEIASADAYLYYPDYATINIYDSNSKLLTTQSVSLSPTSGTQTF